MYTMISSFVYRIPNDAEESSFKEDTELRMTTGRETVTAVCGRGALEKIKFLFK